MVAGKLLPLDNNRGQATFRENGSRGRTRRAGADDYHITLSRIRHNYRNGFRNLEPAPALPTPRPKAAALHRGAHSVGRTAGKVYPTLALKPCAHPAPHKKTPAASLHVRSPQARGFYRVDSALPG